MLKFSAKVLQFHNTEKGNRTQKMVIIVEKFA